MGGVSVEGGGGGKKSVNSEVNMVPMIDLLLCTISFLLITAVWSQMARINADAQVPGPPRTDQQIHKVEPEPQLHVTLGPTQEGGKKRSFSLVWKAGGSQIKEEKIEVQAVEEKGTVKYPELSAKIESQWNETGKHREASDKKFDQAVLHSDNTTPYSELIGVIDAIYAPQRQYKVGEKTEKASAFNVTFAMQ